MLACVVLVSIDLSTGDPLRSKHPSMVPFSLELPSQNSLFLSHLPPHYCVASK